MGVALPGKIGEDLAALRDIFSAVSLVNSRYGHLYTRFADMVKVLSPGRSHGRWAAWLPGCLALVLCFASQAPVRLLAQPPATTKPAPPEAETGTGGQATGKAKADAANDEGGDDQPQTKDQKKADDQPPVEPAARPLTNSKVRPSGDIQGPQRGRASRHQEIQTDQLSGRRCQMMSKRSKRWPVTLTPPWTRRSSGGCRGHGRPVDRHEEHSGPDRSSSQYACRLAGDAGHRRSDNESAGPSLCGARALITRGF